MEDLDYLVVGAGLFGAVFTHEAKQRGKKVLVIDKRDHIGGNVYSYEKWDYGSPLRSAYFPYKQYEGLELFTAVCGIQPFYEFSNSQLQGKNLFASFQHVYL